MIKIVSTMLETTVNPVSVSAQDGYKIWIEFDDGMSGVIDLSRYAGRGVFKQWDDRSHFENVSISAGGFVTWPNDIDLCPEGLYCELTGKTWEEVSGKTEPISIHA